jgi:predicted phage terminase large subunit-like protein
MREDPGSRWGIVADSFGEGRDTMLEGESGLLKVLRDCEFRGGIRNGGWNRSIGELTLANGSKATIYSAEDPGSLRGPNLHGCWADECAKWRDAKRGMDEDTTWSNMALSLRLGKRPRVVVTTTPRSNRLIGELVKTPNCIVQGGSTYENLDNLSPAFRAEVLARYEKTRLGRQELEGLLLEDVEGALWSRDLIERTRIAKLPDDFQMKRIVVAIDPAVTSGPASDETGVVVAGKGKDGHLYVLADLSDRMLPNQWATRAIDAYDGWEADRVIGEVNNGGEMIESTLRQVRKSVPYTAVHASRGKMTRAEPISALWEQGKAHIVGSMPQLEDQMCSYTGESGGDSPDRMDAMVWAATHLVPPSKIFIQSLNETPSEA